MDANIFESQKDRRKLAFGAYTYRQSKVNAKSINWRCDKEKCRGTAATPLNCESPDVKVKTLQAHSHATRKTIRRPMISCGAWLII